MKVVIHKDLAPSNLSGLSSENTNSAGFTDILSNKILNISGSGLRYHTS
jgi:hypothetical protein